jgi:FkbM family methyltransferase
MSFLNNYLFSLGPKNIWEIGVGNPSICRSHPFFNSQTSLFLFEPNPKTYESLVANFGLIPNVKIFNFGLYNKTESVGFLDEDDSTSMVGIDSPTKVIGGGRFGEEWLKNKPVTQMMIRDMAEIDDGTIDVALIDTEGCEYVIVERMKSRPRLLVLETHNENYRTPNYKELNLLLKDRGYSCFHEDLTDSFFALKS